MVPIRQTVFIWHSLAGNYFLLVISHETILKEHAFTSKSAKKLILIRHI